MAFNTGPAGEDDAPVLADINVTPLVDVMLVLLIIFMITAPMLHQGIEVALPRADAESMAMRIDDPLVISINRDGLIYVQDDPIHPSQLVERLQPILAARGDDTVFIKGRPRAPLRQGDRSSRRPPSGRRHPYRHGDGALQVAGSVGEALCRQSLRRAPGTAGRFSRLQSLGIGRYPRTAGHLRGRRAYPGRRGQARADRIRTHPDRPAPGPRGQGSRPGPTAPGTTGAGTRREGARAEGTGTRPGTRCSGHAVPRTGAAEEALRRTAG